MTGSVVVLTGGVGGAKLVRGLAEILPSGMLIAVVNIGDDFSHFGLRISPDIDTLLYSLSDTANREQGWGREGESWNFMSALRSLGGEDWFALGDGDLALHVLRTQRLARGEGLAAITRDFAVHWGIRCRVLPMSEAPIATCLLTDEGELSFQHYFVMRRCVPRVKRITFRGADAAVPAPGVLEAIASAETIMIAPSNPYLSVDPMLAVPGIREAISQSAATVVAVSPLVGGDAVKGPTAKLMKELGLPIDNAQIAAHYAGLINGLLIHDGDDAPEAIAIGRTDTLMHSLEDKVRVARAAIVLAGDCKTT